MHKKKKYRTRTNMQVHTAQMHAWIETVSTSHWKKFFPHQKLSASSEDALDMEKEFTFQDWFWTTHKIYSNLASFEEEFEPESTAALVDVICLYACRRPSSVAITYIKGWNLYPKVAISTSSLHTSKPVHHKNPGYARLLMACERISWLEHTLLSFTWMRVIQFT